MKNHMKTTIVLTISMVVSLLLITIGLSFAYFTANITNTEESTTINVTGGKMDIVYYGGSNIGALNITPDDTPFGTKTFNLTGNNTTTMAMNYHIILIVEENTFSENAIQYKLISTNTDDNGNTVPSIEELTGIPKGDNQEVFLGNANFTSPTTGNKVHTYNLELYFPETGENQNHDMDKIFKAHVEIREGVVYPKELGKNILARYGGVNNITDAPAGTFNSISGETENKMYKMEDDYGMSYYFRGAKSHLSNNLIFAEHQWKIIRINGDGSIRIIYNGTCPNNECSINTIGEQTQITTTAFNPNHTDNKYLGYMYGQASVPTQSYGEAHANEVDSTIKGVLDTWYEDNILENYNSYISDTLFCNDRSYSYGSGYGDIAITEYGARDRIHNNKTPTLKCPQLNADAFTVSNYGNGALTYPIGLLTADEASLAGLHIGSSNTSNYLHTAQSYWLLSPRSFSGLAFPYRITFGASLDYYNADLSGGARAVVNLNSNTEISGSGSLDDPYIVL